MVECLEASIEPVILTIVFAYKLRYFLLKDICFEELKTKYRERVSHPQILLHRVGRETEGCAKTVIKLRNDCGAARERESLRLPSAVTEPL